MLAVEKPFSNDRQYFDGWRRIYEQLWRIQKLRTGDRRGGPWGIEPEERYISATEGELIRKLINEKENFRQRIKAGLNDGKRYVIEEIGKKYGLEEFEKWVILALLGFDYDQWGPGNVPGTVISFLAPKASYGEKIRKERYFLRDGRLARNNIILVDTGYSEREPVKFGLTQGFRDKLFRVMFGEDVDWAEEADEKDKKEGQKGGPHSDREAGRQKSPQYYRNKKKRGK